jgi:hypothetical protein
MDENFHNPGAMVHVTRKNGLFENYIPPVEDLDNIFHRRSVDILYKA